MAAEAAKPTSTSNKPELSRESGQSLLEFMLMLPMMIGLVIILVRVNTAIQVSIVNQQYARSHALWLNFNSPVFPQTQLRELNMTKHGDNQMVILVAGEPVPENGENLHPKAATSYIARKKGLPDSDDKDADERALVRIRDTVTICSQSNVVATSDGVRPVLPLGPGPSFSAIGSYGLSEDPRQFQYCRSNLKYIIESEGT
jgi:hypothetical protein